MMRKELLVSGGMATILTVVTGVVIYFHGGDPTTDVPAADTTAADQPKVEPNVPGWPAGTAANNAANPESKAAESKTAVPSPAPRGPFGDVTSSGGSPWNKPASDPKPPASDEPAKDVARPFGASEAADAASAFSSRFKSDVAAVEKKIDEALPAAGPELKLPNENPLRNPAPSSAATNTPPSTANSTPSTPAASPFGAPPARAEPQSPVATGPAASASPFGAVPFGKSQPAPAASLATSPAASGATPAPPNLSSTTPPANVAAQTPPMRAPTSEDLLWRPQGAANSPPRVTTDLTDNPLRSSVSSSSTTVMPDAAKAGSSPPLSSLAASNAPSTPTTLPTLPRRDAPAARSEPTQSQQPPAQTPAHPAETPAPRQPVQLASTIPVSTPPRTIPMQGGTRTQQLGRVYIVDDGDSLSEIARRELGNSGRAGEIQALNREVLGGSAFLRPGLELILPR